MQKATQSKEITERAEIIENAQMDILGKQTENHGSLSEDELIEILTSTNYTTQGTLSTEETILDKTLTSKDGKYKILVSEIYNGSLKEKEFLKGPNGKPLINNTTVSEITKNKIVGEDKFGNQVVVPKGFKVVEGEIVKEGIVIDDGEGNQYVWVPVSNVNHDGSNKLKVNDESEDGIEITLGRYTFDSSTGSIMTTNGTYQYGVDYASIVTLKSHYQELNEYRQSNGVSNKTGTNTTALNLQAFIESVRDNRGYYIARYEASYRQNGKVGSKISTGTPAMSSPITRTDGQLWNFITQKDAATACYDLYPEKIKSDLINSYAWDTAVLYIQSMGHINFANQKDANGTLKNTGTTGDEKCKINDMASNGCEWTTEYGNDSNSTATWPCTSRGGFYYSGNFWTTYRNPNKAGGLDDSITFRSILYF